MENENNNQSRSLYLERPKLVLGKRDCFWGRSFEIESEDDLETESETQTTDG